MKGKQSLQGSGGSLVLDFDNDGIGTHECFIMVLFMLRIGQNLVLIVGGGTYVQTKKSIKI